MPYKAIALLSMSSPLLHRLIIRLRLVNLKLLSLYNKNIGSQLAVHTLFDWSV